MKIKLSAITEIWDLIVTVKDKIGSILNSASEKNSGMITFNYEIIEFLPGSILL